MKKLVCALILQATVLSRVLPNMGALSQWLDTVAPEQFVDLVDNPDGTYTAYWTEDVPVDEDE